MNAVFLVDFDNVRPDANDLASRKDVPMAADYIKQWLLDYAKRDLNNVDEVMIRFYGGWYLKTRQMSNDASEMNRWIHKSRGRDRVTGLRINAELAFSLVESPTSSLYGTLRISSRAICKPICAEHCKRNNQKMVDMMIALDFLAYAEREPTHLVLVTSDEDMVPAMVTATVRSVRALSMTWLRPDRPSGDSPNDHYLSSTALNLIA